MGETCGGQGLQHELRIRITVFDKQNTWRREIEARLDTATRAETARRDIKLCGEFTKLEVIRNYQYPELP